MIQDCRSLVDLLRNWSTKTPNNIAFTFLNKISSIEEQLTYGQLENKARAIAAAIQAHGLKKGDRALLIFVPGLDLIEAFFGCMFAGVIAVPVFPPINPKLLEKTHRIVKNARPKLVLMTQDCLLKFGSFQDKTQLPNALQPQTMNKQNMAKKIKEQIWLYEKSPCLATNAISTDLSKQWEELTINPNDLAFLQYTSGSTSYPKGVMISHGNLLDNLSKIFQAFGANEHSIGFSWLPPYHDMGLIGNVLTPIYGGFPVILMTPFSFLQNPLSWLQNISKYQATISGSPNFAYDYCVRRIKEEKKQGLDLSSWQVAFNGAEPIHPETMERFYQAFKDYGFRKEAFYPCYGLAEATLLVTKRTPLELYRTLNIAKESLKVHRVHFQSEDTDTSQNLVSNGKMYHTVKIVDPDTLEECEKDVIGEIWVNNLSVAYGYWQQPEETEHAFNGKIKGDSSNTRFLRTGDLGFIHDKELYVTGRIKDLIILYGKNHYPQDIEYTLNHSALHAELGSCAAFVTAKDEEYRLTVLCEVKNRSLDEVAQTELFASIFELVYQEHQLEIHTIVLTPLKTIPKTTSGKISRSFCRQHLLNNTIPVVATWHLTDE